MKSLEQSISPGQQKINEYAERIRKGADPAQVMQGLGGNFRDGIEKRLLELENQDIKNNEIKEALAEQKLETGFESQSQSEIFIEKVPDQEQVLREQQKQERLAREQEQIEELREQLGVVSNKQEFVEGKKDDESHVEKLLSRIEKYSVVFPNIDSIIENEGGSLEVVINGEKINFNKFILSIEPESKEHQREAIVGFIEKTERTKNSGIGVPIYLELGKQLAERGIILSSSNAQYGPGQSVWMNLAKLGYASRGQGGIFSFDPKKLELSKYKKETINNHEGINQELQESLKKLEDIEQKESIIGKKYEEVYERIHGEISRGNILNNQQYNRVLELASKETNYFAQYELGYSREDLRKEKQAIEDQLSQKYIIPDSFNTKLINLIKEGKLVPRVENKIDKKQNEFESSFNWSDV